MPTENGLLLFLVADLIRSSDMRRRFKMDPKDVMDDYGLKQHQRCALYTMDRNVIGDFIVGEFLQNARLAGAPIAPVWPSPDPQVRAFEPASARQGSVVEFEVRGEGLLDGAVVRLVPRGEAAPPVFQSAAATVQGDFREARIRVTLDLTGVAPGDYAVEVVNCPDARPLRSVDFDVFTVLPAA